MKRGRFSRRDGLIIGALAAFGSVSSVALRAGGPAACTYVGLPGGLQSLSGLHVLPLVLAAALTGRWGAAALVGLLQGCGEAVGGSAHGLLALAYPTLAGLVVDLVAGLMRERQGLLTNLLAGGLGTTSNVLVLVCSAGLSGACRNPTHPAVVTVIAFSSGVVLAGGLGFAVVGGLQHLTSAGRLLHRRGLASVE